MQAHAATKIEAAYRGHAVRRRARQAAAEATHCLREKADVGALDDMLEHLDVEESDFVADHLDLLKMEAQTIRGVANGKKQAAAPLKPPHEVLKGRRRWGTTTTSSASTFYCKSRLGSTAGIC